MIALVVSVGTLALAGSASAAETQVFQSSFNGAGSTKGPFSAGSLGEMAIDQQTGTVYVVDHGKEVVDKFDASGRPTPFSALGVTTISQHLASSVAVDNSPTATQGSIYMTGNTTPDVAKYEPDGSPAGGNFPLPIEGEACAVTVSPSSGNIWAVNTSNATEYDSAGTRTGAAASSVLCKATVDAAGDLYGGLFTQAKKFEQTSATEYNPIEPSPFPSLPYSVFVSPTFAVDPLNQDVYLDMGDSIYAFHPSNERTEPFNVISGFVASNGLAFDGQGNLYVADAGKSGDPSTTKVYIFKRQQSTAPVIKSESALNVHSNSAELGGQIVAAGSATSYRIEYGPDASYGNSLPTVELGSNATPYAPKTRIEGLAPGATYHYRLVATNAEGTTYGPDRTFSTFPIPAGGTETCPNALARKQTAAQALPDCRAYELVSAPDTGGYDVESSLVVGQTPFAGYPDASGRVLYAAHSGVIPGPWNATNKGPDPYVATRGADGWTTNYEGLPADLNPAAGSFSSVLGEADSSLDTLAFAGPGLCSPCFTSGLETGIPLRLPDGRLVQGMAGSLSGSVPVSAKPEGKLGKYFSADGKHLLFASKYAFEPGADTGGDLTVYERDLNAGTTEIVSTDPSGSALTGSVSELDVSSNGSRVVIGKKVSVDSQGNEYVHPYLHLGGEPNGVDLTPGSTSGVLYDGMTVDGSKVFFTTADKLLPADTDESADIYAAEVDSSGDVVLSLVSAGSSAACDPVADTNGEHWNTTGATADCGAVAIAGGGGVAGASGDVYFLSPEQLESGEGILNQPNLYLATPGGSPRFVATLEADNPLVLDSVKAGATRRTGDFQTTPSGGYAAFTATEGFDTPQIGSNAEVFRYDAASGQLGCASCDPTNADVSGDATLAPNGLSLTDDGRVFFTTPLALVLNDTDSRADVYEQAGAGPRLISAGTSSFDSTLLSASADGTDAYFFTHDALAPEEDRSGQLVKIYDAREGGGFFKLPGEVPCAASDECHGAGTIAPGAPDIKSSGKTTDGNVLVCRKGRVKKRGQCVKAKHRHAKKAHAKKRKANTNRKRGASHA